MNQTTPKNLSAEEYLALDLEFDLWVSDGACIHQDMEIATERISNWAGLRAFQDALHFLGDHFYATLLREIPNSMTV